MNVYTNFQIIAKENSIIDDGM